MHIIGFDWNIMYELIIIFYLLATYVGILHSLVHERFVLICFFLIFKKPDIYQRNAILREEKFHEKSR